MKEKNRKEFWTVTEVVEFFQVDEAFLKELEEEEVLCPVQRADPRKKLFSSPELEKLRLAKILYEDLGVNLAGVDIILRMRQNMIDMRWQFDEIMEDLARRLRKTLE
jgi:MerR family transcriptional regulator/heat shock protein HspR